MDSNDPNYPIPILKLNEHGYPGRKAHHYRERAAGRLTTTQMGGRTYVLKKDADAWLNSLPKVGNPGETVLQAAKQKLVELGKAVESGQIDRARVVEHLADVARRTGLTHQAA